MIAWLQGIVELALIVKLDCLVFILLWHLELLCLLVLKLVSSSLRLVAAMLALIILVLNCLLARHPLAHRLLLLLDLLLPFILEGFFSRYNH